MKAALREKMLSLRNSLSESELKEKSSIIAHRLFSFGEFTKAKTIMFYVSAGSEVRTHEMIKEALAKKRVAVPVTEGKTLQASELKDFSELEKGAFGIPEPGKKFIRPIEAKGLDLIIVPGIAFDAGGSRIGYGHGYYDNFLKGASAPKIALAFEVQIAGEVPSHENDIRMDFIVTEERLIECRS